MRHPLDPPSAHAAAAFLGHLAAAGLTDRAEAGRVLAAAAARAGTGRAGRGPAAGVDPSGLATRLAHAFADAHTHWARRRHHAVARIRAHLAPLLEAGAARGAIVRAAEAAADESLLPGEARALAAAFAAERLRRR